MKALNLKNIKNLKGERKTMKNAKRMGVLLVVVAMVMSFFTVSASAYGYTSDYYGSQSYGSNVNSYVPDYSGNGGIYNGQFNYRQDNNNYGYYGRYSNDGYYDAYGRYYANNNFAPDQWFNSQYGDRFKFHWIQSPQSPATRGDFFRLVFDQEMSNSRNSYNRYNTGFQNQQFADYWKYGNKYARLISVLNSTGGYVGSNILDGREVDGQLYLDFDMGITRSEAAKLLVQSNNVWWNISQVRSPMEFADCYDHWAYYEVGMAYALGFVDGVGYNCFNPDASMTNQEMVRMFCNVVDRSNKYSIYDFINMINASDVARITEVNWNNNNNGGNTSWSFYPKEVDMYVQDTFDLTSIISNYNSTITFSVNSNKASLSGRTLYANAVGTVTVTARDSYGNSDTARINIKNRGSNITPPPVQNEFAFNQSVVTMQRGTNQDFSLYIENANGNVQLTSANPAYVSVYGTQVTANQVTTDGPITLTAYCNGETATIQVKVVDNNAAEQLNISYEFAYEPLTNVVSVVVKGLPDGYTTKINAGDYPSEQIDYQKIGLANTQKICVTGLFPEGGRDTLVVCVYNREGVQVDESRKYCPQLKSYVD